MSKVVKVYNSNYKVAVQSGGTITLDTGDLTGTTIITGNLEIKGTTSTVRSTDVEIKDNILRLNVPSIDLGDANYSGIPASLGYKSGIEIERGSLPDVRWIYDEQVSWTLGGTNGTGTFYAERENGDKLPIATPGIVAGGTLYVSTGAGTISVTGTNNYEENVWNYSGGVVVPDANGSVVIDDDNIPNAKAVKDYVDYTLANPTFSAIAEGNSSIEVIDEVHSLSSIADIDPGGSTTTIVTTGQHGFVVSDTVDISGVSSAGDPIENLNGNNITITEISSANSFKVAVDTSGGTKSNYVSGSGTVEKTGFIESRIAIDVEGSNTANFYSNRIELDGIKIQDTEISSTVSNADLVLAAPGAGSIKVKDVLELTPTPWDSDPNSLPLAPNEGVKIYTLSAADSSGFSAGTTGDSGIYFVNSNEQRDELIAKNRALLFSMIF